MNFEAPGPGAWRLADEHFPGPVTHYMRGVAPPAHVEGYHQAVEEYGHLYDREIAVVNGYWYVRNRPVVAPPTTTEAVSGSPAAMDDEAAFRDRLDRLAETYATKRWRDDLERWDDDWKPTHQDTNRRLQAVDPTALSEAELVDHLEDCRAAYRRGLVLHHRMNMAVRVPVGDVLAHATRWTSYSPAEAIALLDGATPDSVGPIDELRAVATAIEASDPARDVLFSDASPGTVIDRLRAAGDAVATAIEDWLAVVGYRPISGWDLTSPYALERPATLVRSLRRAVEGTVDGPREHGTADLIDEIRREVPTEHRETFAELVEEARLVFRIRDERDFVSLPSQGITRRAILEVGRRLADRDRLHEPDHALDMAHDELLAALRGELAPEAGAVAERVAYRRSHGRRDAPDRLGEAPSDPFAEFERSDAARRTQRAIRTSREAFTPDRMEDASAPETLDGVGASSGTVEGTARVVSGPAHLSDVQDGEILVVETTSPGYNVILPLIAGVVTDLGGRLSHAAIVAREYGIPAVVGCEEATDAIDTGDHIVVDGEEGRVRIAE